MHWPSSPLKLPGSDALLSAKPPRTASTPFTSMYQPMIAPMPSNTFANYAWNAFKTQETLQTQKIILYYKTSPCPDPNNLIRCPNPATCFNYHSAMDRRRPPFTGNKIAYSHLICSNIFQNKPCPLGDRCGFSHSQLEAMYHPAKYKTTFCAGCCAGGQLCPCAHSDKEIRNPATLLVYQQQAADFTQQTSFVDLGTFKAYPCTFVGTHNHKRCVYYHSSNDRRRVPVFYSPDRCSTSQKTAFCPQGDVCPKAHNAVEQLYHPEKYKKRMCHEFYSGKKECEYGDYCCFAHSQVELKVELLHEMVKDEVFYMEKFKTEWCPFNHDHNKSICVYAHNWQDYRRKPIGYSAQPCLNWKYDLYISDYAEGCVNGFACGYSHGWKEQPFHPGVYKTILCPDALKCHKGPDCPYYHSITDRRFTGTYYHEQTFPRCPEEVKNESKPIKYTATQLQVAPLTEFESLKNASETEPEAFWSPQSYTRSSNNDSIVSESLASTEKTEHRPSIGDGTRSCPLTPVLTKKYKGCNALKSLHLENSEEEEDKNNRKLEKLLKEIGLERYYKKFVEARATIYDLMIDVERKCKGVGIDNEEDVRKIKERVASKIENLAEPDSPGTLTMTKK